MRQQTRQFNIPAEVSTESFDYPLSAMNDNRFALKVAVAEDDGNLRKTYVAMLECLGHTVVCAAENGAELLEHCVGERIDLVVADLDMPVVDGLAVAEEVSKKKIPVILVSGHPDVEEIVVEREPIATRMVKPVTLGGLQSAIEQAVGSDPQ
jgi:two-component system, response regulator PdtaR